MDDFIDAIMTVGCTRKNWKRLAGAALLSLHVLGRPIFPDEPLSRDDMVALNKLQAEGRLREQQIVLGWDANTRNLTVRLPDDKFGTWDKSTHDVILSKQTSCEELESLIGRLNHAAMIIPLARHFMGRTHRLLNEPIKKNLSSMSPAALADLDLWQSFLANANQGISLNLIVERDPDHVFITDSCENGIGGFSLLSGKAWRFELPDHLKGIISNDVLECLAEIVATWVGVLDGEVKEDDCVFSGANSTTAVGWTFHANFSDD